MTDFTTSGYNVIERHIPETLIDKVNEVFDANKTIENSKSPYQLEADDEEEVTQKVTELVNSGITQVGAIMKEFATLPADKKMVSEVIKEVTTK